MTAFYFTNQYWYTCISHTVEPHWPQSLQITLFESIVSKFTNNRKSKIFTSLHGWWSEACFQMNPSVVNPRKLAISLSIQGFPLFFAILVLSFLKPQCTFTNRIVTVRGQLNVKVDQRWENSQLPPSCWNALMLTDWPPPEYQNKHNSSN